MSSEQEQAILKVMSPFVGQWRTLRAIRSWVREQQSEAVNEEEIERQIQGCMASWYEPGRSEEEMSEGTRVFLQEKADEYLELCRTLSDYPQEATEAVFASWEQRLATIVRTEDALQVLEEQVRDVYESLDDRTRYIIIVLARLSCLEGFSQVRYFNKIENDFYADAGFLEAQSCEFANDPQLACLVKAAKLGQVLYAIRDEESAVV